jgi:DNA-binding NarL/FixJ family response regulator
MTANRLVLPLAQAAEAVRYVLIDDEPVYRQPLGATETGELLLVGGYGNVEAFIGIQRQPCHVVVLDLCLNRQTGDAAVLQGVLAIRTLAITHGHRILVYTADERPEPVARCVAAGASGFVSKYGDPSELSRAVVEIGRRGRMAGDAFAKALRELSAHCHDVRLSETLEETLVLLDRGMTDRQIADLRHLSPRTIEDHKRKILELFGAGMEQKRQGFADLTRQLGVSPGDVVNDPAGARPVRGAIRRALERTRAGWLGH